jgi:hypothetical protein
MFALNYYQANFRDIFHIQRRIFGHLLSLVDQEVYCICPAIVTVIGDAILNFVIVECVGFYELLHTIIQPRIKPLNVGNSLFPILKIRL